MDRFNKHPMMDRLFWILKVLPCIGLTSISRVIVYRLKLMSGYFKLLLLVQKPTSISSTMFNLMESDRKQYCDQPLLIAKAKELVDGKMQLFSHFRYDYDGLPNWHLDPLHQVGCSGDQHWTGSRVLPGGDVKCIWEASRFHWALTLAQASRLSSDPIYLDTLNRLVFDWQNNNPAYQGINWQCGQETSIRLINMLLAWWILGKGDPTVLRDFVAVHLARIRLTISYALAQDNNHGTTEAAALFIGGAWLEQHAEFSSQIRLGKSCKVLGAKWLQERVAKLVFADGGFSQYSTNYHRVLLDTLSQVEFWRREMSEPQFSACYLAKVRLAINWLESLVVGSQGEVPNIGANDGGRLFSFSDSEFEDFRPSVDLASVLFNSNHCFGDAGSNQTLAWLNLKIGNRSPPDQSSKIYKDFGLVSLRRGCLQVFIRFSNFRFRPSQADCLHMDVFYNGENVLTDSGSFSYHDDLHDYFSGPCAHNTVSFEDSTQMPRISRFLFGQWLSMEFVGEIVEQLESVSWEGGYTDYKGNSHHRKVVVMDHEFFVEDQVIGVSGAATLAWHVQPSEYQIVDEVVIGSNKLQLSFEGVDKINRSDSLISTKYLQKIVVPGFEAKIAVEPGRGGTHKARTKIRFSH